MPKAGQGWHELEVPGRLCLFGEHSDWAAQYRARKPALSPGYCIVAGTEQQIPARARRRDASVRVSSALGAASIEVPAQPLGLATEARRHELFGYVLGVASVITGEFDVAGIELEIGPARLPARKGLSSSAAVCVLTARAFGRAYGLGLAAEQEMDLAYRGERLMGSECGRMDQVCALGRQLSFLTFDGDAMAIEPIEMEGAVHLLVVDLARAKDTRRILADLNHCFPSRAGRLAEGVRRALGPLNEALLVRARSALARADAAAVGALMSEAQRVFDEHVAPASRELAAPVLHELLEWAPATGLVWGGKGVGSQGEGCAQFVTKGREARRELAERLLRERGLRSLELSLGG